MTAADDLGFVHRFVPSASGSALALLLLHGTGGNEHDLIGLGKELAPNAALLSPRGRVLENGMPRFFRRLAEGVFDMDDLRLQTGLLAQFIRVARLKYGLGTDKLIAVGYSNGANIASSLLLTEPGLLAGAMLFRAMPALVPHAAPDLRSVSVLLTAGRRDPIVTPQQTLTLAEIFESAGAAVSLHWHNGGHELGEDDIEAARVWIAQQAPSA